MKTNKDAEAWLRLQDLKFWRVYLGTTDKIVAKSEEKETEDNHITIDKSVHSFAEIMATMPAGEYMLAGRKTVTAYSGEVFYPFHVIDTGREANDYQKRVTGVTSTYSAEIGALQKKLDDMERKNWERERDEYYRRKYAKNQKPAEDAMMKFSDVIGKLHSMWTGKKPEPEPEPEAVGNAEAPSDEQIQNLQNYLTALQQKMGEQNLINALKSLASKTPEALQQLIKFL